MHYKMKKIGVSLLLLVGIILLSGLVSAVNVSIDSVKIDGDELSDTTTNKIRSVERGEEFEVKVEVSANADVEDAQIEVRLTGLHHDEARDETDTFDMVAGVTYVKKLSLTLPERMDADTFNLRVRVDERTGDTSQKDYTLKVERPGNLVVLRDVVFSPINEVKAGRSLLTVVRVTNRGEGEEEGVKVTVSIPALGIAAADFIEDLEADESTTSEEIYMRVPANAEAGDYDVRIEIEFDDGDSSKTYYETITVVSDEGAPAMPTGPTTTVTVPGSKSVSGGAATVYPITITNGGATSTTYTLSVSGVGAWGTYTLEPSNVLVIPAGATSTAFLSVTANAGVTGTYTFAVEVATSEATETVTLEAEVDGGAAPGVVPAGTVRRALEIGLIVLVVLLVIIGLIVGYNKLRGTGAEAEEEGAETYY